MLSPLARCSIAAIAAVLMSHEYHRWIVLDTHHNADCITLMARDYNPRLAATSSLKAYRPPTTAVELGSSSSSSVLISASYRLCSWRFHCQHVFAHGGAFHDTETRTIAPCSACRMT
eukprot:994-Heterococcus_DN1.PRE.1